MRGPRAAHAHLLTVDALGCVYVAVNGGPRTGTACSDLLQQLNVKIVRDSQVARRICIEAIDFLVSVPRHAARACDCTVL